MSPDYYNDYANHPHNRPRGLSGGMMFLLVTGPLLMMALITVCLMGDRLTNNSTAYLVGLGWVAAGAWFVLSGVVCLIRILIRILK
jgi:hypothetical protein